MHKSILLIFIFCIKITTQAHGVVVLSQSQIMGRSGAIIAKDNAMLLGGPQANHHYVIRQNRSDNFKRFLRNVSESTKVNTRNNAILALRNVVNNAQLRGIFANDLEDPFNFVLKRLLRSEILHQNIPPFVLGAAINHMNDMVLLVTDGTVSATGMLIPIPTVGVAAAARPITWRVLTCAHSIPNNRLGDDNPIQMRVIMPALGAINFPLASLKVFKRPARDAAVDNGGGQLPPNTLIFPDVRALPKYDIEGDVAWCDLAIPDGMHAFLTFMLNVPPVGAVGFPAIAANMLTFQRNIPGTAAPVTYTIRLVNVLADANNTVAVINALPKNQNFILGFPGFGGGGLTIAQARTAVTQIYPGFIDPAGAGFGHNEFSFFHDAPSYWGMSGGPIFHVGVNAVEIFGIVKGAETAFAGPLASRCKGTFIRNF